MVRGLDMAAVATEVRRSLFANHAGRILGATPKNLEFALFCQYPVKVDGIFV
jgi:hypothetical protein